MKQSLSFVAVTVASVVCPSVAFVPPSAVLNKAHHTQQHNIPRFTSKLHMSEDDEVGFGRKIRIFCPSKNFFDIH
jgi:hypothetical protein